MAIGGRVTRFTLIDDVSFMRCGMMWIAKLKGLA